MEDDRAALKHDWPDTQGKENVLLRAKLCAGYRWTPLRDVPRTVRVVSQTCPEDTPKSKYEAWRPVVGLPYSSVRYEEKFIGINVSFETYYTALMNPESVLYKRDLTGKGKRMSSWYGMVCSSFVSFALGLKCRRVCAVWASFDDIEELSRSSVDDIQLCDVLCSKTHMALVTDIARNGDGKPVLLTVTECTTPKMAVQAFTAEEFEKFWLAKYKIYRYRDIDSVNFPEDPYCQITPAGATRPYFNHVLLPNYGNRANYRMEERVELNVMEEGWGALYAENDRGEAVWSDAVFGTGVYTWTPTDPGFYKLWCAGGGKKSDAVEICVTDFSAEIADTVKGPAVTFKGGPDDECISCFVSRRKDRYAVLEHVLTEDEKAARICIITGLTDGEYELKAIAQNRFGQYSTKVIPLDVG